MVDNIAPDIDLLARDFNRNRDRAQQFLLQRVKEFAFGEFVRTGVAIPITDLIAWFHEIDAHYIDRVAIGSLLSTADTLERMILLARAQGYRVRPATSSATPLIVIPNPPQAAQITLTKATPVQIGDLTFEIAEDFTIPPGVASWPDGTTDDVIVLVEGATRTERFVSTGENFQFRELSQPSVIADSVVVSISGEFWEEVASLAFVEGTQLGRDSFVGDGTDDQQFELSLLNAIVDRESDQGVIVLITMSGQPSSTATRWQQVDAFTGAPEEYRLVQDTAGVTTLIFGDTSDASAPTSGDSIDVIYIISGAQKRYQLTFDEQFRGTVRFGDGNFGIVPPNGANVVITYRIGGGPRGNIPRGTVNVAVQGLLPSGGATSVDLRNVEKGSGGEPPEEIEHVRFFAPRRAKGNERAVTLEGFVALAGSFCDPVFGAPAHASAMLKQKIPERNTIILALWSRDDRGRFDIPGRPLKLVVKKFLDTKKTAQTDLEMVDGRVVIVDIDVSIELAPGNSRQSVFARVQQSISDFFLSSFVLPGENLSISKLYAAIKVLGVEQSNITAIVAGERVLVDLGVGDGVTAAFSGDFTLKEGTVVVPLSVEVTATEQQAVDDGDGGLTGNINVAGTNTIDYDNGRFTVTFASPPTSGTPIAAEARAQVFSAIIESLGGSDGNVSFLDSATERFPIVKRAPQGTWSGDMVKVIDGFQVGTSAQVRGTLPRGIVPTTLTIINLAQTVVDNGVGILLQGATPVGTVDYATGTIDFTFLAAVSAADPIRATWTTKTVDITIDSSFLPLASGRLFFWGGFSVDGVQPGGTELTAFDDGEGNIVGSVLPGGTVNYENGRVVFEWVTNPPPGPGGGASLVGTLTPAPDGTTRTFAISGLGDISRFGAGGEGRTRFQFSDLSTPGLVVEDAYDNWQGVINGPSVDNEGDNSIIYTPGTGTVTFLIAPAATAPAVFAVEITNVTTVLYSAWVFRVKTPGTPGLDKGLFADNRGRLWGDIAQLFPINRLDHLRGRFIASFSGSPIAVGRELQLTYDALTGAPPLLDIPIEGDQLATVGRVGLVEAETESDFV